MGFTLRAALGALGTEARISCGRTGAGRRRVGAGSDGRDLRRQPERSAREHPRNRRHGNLSGRSASNFDAILLDVDNGPEGLTRKANDALYELRRIERGARGAAAGRRAGGLVSGPDPAFAKRLRGAGFEVNEVNIRATGRGGGARHIIWIASKS